MAWLRASGYSYSCIGEKAFNEFILSQISAKFWTKDTFSHWLHNFGGFELGRRPSTRFQIITQALVVWETALGAAHLGQNLAEIQASNSYWSRFPLQPPHEYEKYGGSTALNGGQRGCKNKRQLRIDTNNNVKKTKRDIKKVENLNVGELLLKSNCKRKKEVPCQWH